MHGRRDLQQVQDIQRKVQQRSGSSADIREKNEACGALAEGDEGLQLQLQLATLLLLNPILR